MIAVVIILIITAVMYYWYPAKKKNNSIIHKNNIRTESIDTSGLTEKFLNAVIEKSDTLNYSVTQNFEENNISQKNEDKFSSLVIVIDDVGSNLKLLKEFLSIEAELNFAVIPDLEHTDKSMELIMESGKNLLLHLPIEPENPSHMKNAKDFILTSMTDSEIEKRMSYLFEKYSGIDGINNHMGSKGTADSRLMNILMSKIKSYNMTVSNKKIFFLDSRTSPKTEAYSIAKKYDIGSILNQGFLDNEDNEQKIFDRLNMFYNKSLSEKKTLVVIGHLRHSTLSAIKRFVLSEPFLSGKINFISCKEYLLDKSIL